MKPFIHVPTFYQQSRQRAVFYMNRDGKLPPPVACNYVRALALKAGYNPDQTRDDQGRWSEGSGGSNVSSIYDPPLVPVYPVESALAFTAMSAARAVSTAEAALEEAASVLSSSSVDHTQHGSERMDTRGISQSDVEEAISSAKENNSVTTKIGKYGTPQYHYRGSNGIIVIQETTGRNAGKTITSYRH